ncbi:DUF4105 domain-containing protein [bacterium]|nr:MAG: DUF4105 domain-containing protein [bacterium]
MNRGAGVRKGARPFLFLLLAARVQAAPLWEEPEWRRLLHIKGSVTDARPGPFFLSPDGEPRAELEALETALRDDSPDPLSTAAEPAGPEPRRCRFPARVAWLAERRGLDAAELLKPCRRFAAWRDLLAADGVALVFASAYLNNPSSMFGHTFLRLERRGEDRLLDNSLNFAAETAETSGVAFAFRGLTGLYPGKYTAMPYYLKVQEYGAIENRDLWEYRLNLSSAEVSRLAAHAWELGQAEFPYYFLSKNCSYQLMPALEAAAPRLTLFGTPPIVGPMDTVMAVAATPGLVRETVYRPSHATTLRQRRALLSTAERRAAWAYAAGRAEEGDARSAAFPEGRRALVLEAAHDLILYRYGFNPEVASSVRKLEHPLLVRRGRLQAEAPAPAQPTWALPPDQAHRRKRLSVGAGAERGGAFAEASWRAGLHALEDAAPAYLPGNAIEGMSGRLRYDGPSESVYLRDLRAIDIVSLTPFDSWTRKPSWALGTGLDTAFSAGRAPAESLVYDGRGATGVSWGRPEGGPGVVGLLAGGEFAVGPVLRGGGRLGGILCLVGAWDAGPLRAALRASLGGAVLGDRRPDHRLAASFDWSLSRDRSLRASYFMNGPHREARLNAVLFH